MTQEKKLPPKQKISEEQLKFLNNLYEVFPDVDKNQNPDKLLEGLAVKLRSGAFSHALGNVRDERESLRFKAALAYAAVYTKVTNVRLDMLKEIEKMRFFYLVDVLLSQMTEDALAPELGTGDVLTVSSEKPDQQKEIELLNERFNFDQLATNICPDLLAGGEYIIATEVKPVRSIKDKTLEEPEESIEKSKNRLTEKLHSKNRKKITKETVKEQKDDADGIDTGLIALHDIVEQGTVVALSKDGVVESYLIKATDSKVDKREPADFIRFALDSQRIRVDLVNEFSFDRKSVKDIFKDIPRFVRVGKSCIWPVLGKIKELQLLETLVPATKINKLTTGSLVGVQVPPGYSIENALEAAKKVENTINKKVGIDEKLGEINIENILSAAGKTKVVPLFGEKGQLEKIDFRSDEPDELLSSIGDLRRLISSSIGVPYELIFGGEDGSKGEILKRYARYLRKLKSIQRAIQDGIKQIVFIHLANKDIEFEPEDISIEFKNKLVEIDNLDRLEFTDTTLSMVNNVKQFVFELIETDSPLKEAVNLKVFVEWMNDQLSTVGFDKLVDPEKLPEIPIDFEQDQDDIFPLPPGQEPDEPPGDSQDQEPPSPEPAPVQVEPAGSGDNL